MWTLFDLRADLSLPRELGSQQLLINGYDLWAINRYSVAPTTCVEIIRPVDGGLSIDKVRWEWSPFCAKDKRPDPINARVKTVTTENFFKQLWPAGRAIAPANGWFLPVEKQNSQATRIGSFVWNAFQYS